MRIHIISRYNTHCHKNLHRLGIYFHNDDDDELVIIINRNQHDDCKLAHFITQQKNQMVSFTVYVAPAPSCNSCVSGIEKCIFECQYENHITKHKSIAMTSSQTPTHFTLPPF